MYLKIVLLIINNLLLKFGKDFLKSILALYVLIFMLDAELNIGIKQNNAILF